jgi:hypothetical protein
LPFFSETDVPDRDHRGTHDKESAAYHADRGHDLFEQFHLTLPIARNEL